MPLPAVSCVASSGRLSRGSHRPGQWARLRFGPTGAGLRRGPWRPGRTRGPGAGTRNDARPADVHWEAGWEGHWRWRLRCGNPANASVPRPDSSPPPVPPVYPWHYHRRYFLRALKKIKSAVGEIMAVHQVSEKSPGSIKNYGIAYVLPSTPLAPCLRAPSVLFAQLCACVRVQRLPGPRDAARAA